MPQSTAIEVVTVLKTVGRHGYSKFAKSIKGTWGREGSYKTQDEWGK
jgi:hypothetical protein